MTLLRVSFVIPTLNSAATLEACLKSIVGQDYPEKEIIIVDGGSRDSTLKIASQFATRVLSRKGPLGLARQIGCAVAEGDILGIFDSDIELPHANWLSGAVAHFQSNPRITIVWPRNVAPPNASIVTKSYFHLWEAFMQERQGENVLPGGNSLILKRVFDNVGGFNVTIRWGEDFDLTRKIIAKGYKVAVNDDPIFHDSMRTLREFTSKQIRAASSLSQVMKYNEVLGRRLIEQSMTWSDSQTQNSLVKYAVIHIMIGMKWSVRKFLETKELSWLLVPVLLGIRVMVYSPYYLKTQIQSRY
jgi:glycosyltransferase involved in cell wall biosynthesis